MIRCDRPTHGSGVRIFVKTHLNYVRIPPQSECAKLKLLCIDIMQDQWIHRFVIVYRAPRCSVQQTESIMSCLNFFSNASNDVYLCGAFNMPKIDLINGFDIACLPPLETHLTTFVIDNGLHQLVREPPRGTNTHNLLMTNDPIAVSCVSVTCLFSISDHRCVKWRVWLPNHCVQQFKRTTAKRFDCQSVDYIALFSYLSTVNWVELLGAVAPCDFNGL